MNNVGSSSVSSGIVEEQRKRLVSSGVVGSSETKHTQQNPQHNHPDPRICILDGFLLYPPLVLAQLHAHLDLKLFLPVSYTKMKARREARKGYVTAEGFWEDPEGYVDEVVWPNYVRDHGFLFEGGDVEGAVDGRVLEGLGVRVWEDWREGMVDGALEWAVGVLSEAFGRGSG
jgi:nicotinamide/nicotinate riboside kinase